MNVQQDVTNAYDTIIKEMTDKLMTNEQFKEIFTEAQMDSYAELKV